MIFTFKKGLSSVISLLKSYNLEQTAKGLRENRQNRKLSESVRTDCDDIIEIIGCEGMNPNNLLEAKTTTLMTRLEMFVDQK